MAGEVPTVTTAKSSVAQSYVRAATSAATVGNSAESELEALRGGSGVAELTKKLTDNSLGGGDAGATPPKRAAVAELEGKSKATGVDAMRKYREAKEAEAAASPTSPLRGTNAGPPPKVDLYK